MRKSRVSMEGGLVSECEVGSGSAMGWEGGLHGGAGMCVVEDGNDHLLNTLEPTMCQAMHWVLGDIESPCPSGAQNTEEKGINTCKDNKQYQTMYESVQLHIRLYSFSKTFHGCLLPSG